MNKLKEKVKHMEQHGEPMDFADWADNEGILITGNEAKAILQHTAQLQADKAELLEMLSVFLPMFTELDSEFGIENPHPRKWTEAEIETVQKISDLIQKHKQ